MIAKLAEMAKLYKTRPSSLIDVEDDYIAYCIDEAVAGYAYRIGAGAKPRNPAQIDKPQDNNALIRAMNDNKRR